MKNQKKHETQDEIALARYKIISPILTATEEGADKGKIGMLKSEACGQAGISRKTLARWLNSHAQKGFEGLKYNTPASGAKRKIPHDLVKEAIQLKLEVPVRSIPQIIEILELEGRVPVGFLKQTTLRDRLREEGYSTTQMKLYQKPGLAARRFARSERNAMWQSDIKFGPALKIGGENVLVYFVGFIDDATRYIVHGEFYDSLDQSIVEDCLRKAIMKEGAPRRVFLDNGAQYRNKWMTRACAILNVKLIYAKPYSPESKGKIERFNRSLDSFIAESSLKRAGSLSEYNELFKVWLEECYHKREHAGIDATPEQAYKSSSTPLRFLPVETVANAFLHSERRKVDKSGCISFKGKKYEVGITFIGRTVDVIYDACDISAVTVEDKHLNASIRVKELVIGEHTGPRPKLPDFMTSAEPETSRLLDEKQKLYDKRQLSAKRAISYAQLNKSGEGAENV